MAERGVSGVGANYRLSEGDELKVAVLGVDELHRSVRVSERGRITLPLIPPVHVQGLTLIEARDAVTKALQQFMQDPIVDLSIVERKAVVAVMGEINNPGSFPLEGFDETITDLLARAGGLTVHAGPTLFLFTAGSAPADATKSLVASTKTSGLIREVSFAKQAAIEIDLTRLYRGEAVPELDLPLRAGDAILIPGAGQFFINGWVSHPGAFMLETRMTLTQAVAKAGGLTFGASRSWVKLVRSRPEGEPLVYWVDYTKALSDTPQDPLLQSGDRLEVQAEPVRATGWALWDTIRRIFWFRAGGNLGTL